MKREIMAERYVIKVNGYCDTYTNKYTNKYTASVGGGNMNEDEEDDYDYEGENEVNVPYEGCVLIDRNSYLITPAHDGFLIYTNPTGNGIKTTVKETWENVVVFLKENELLNLTQEEIVDSL